MNSIAEQRALGRLTRSEMIAALDMSESSFDRLGVEPVHREGRHTFYLLRDVLLARLERQFVAEHPGLRTLRELCPAAAKAAARVMAESSLSK